MNDIEVPTSNNKNMSIALVKPLNTDPHGATDLFTPSIESHDIILPSINYITLKLTYEHVIIGIYLQT